MFSNIFFINGRRTIFLACALTLMVSACGGSSGTTATTTTTATISGSAGDGPIVNGTVTVVDANGNNAIAGGATSVTTDANAHYSVSILTSAVLPLTLTITGGIDQVTGLAPEFPLKTAVTSTLSTVNDTNANANPLSTIAVESAIALGGVTTANLQTAVDNVRNSLGFGADFDPIGTVITAANVGKATKANEAAAELIRRAKVSTGKSLANTIKAIAEDLTDGVVDGNVASGVTATQVSAKVAAQIQSKIAEISLETMTNTLKITDSTGATLVANATNKLNAAITTSISTATDTVDLIPVSAAFIQQARAAVQAANALATGSSTSAGALKNLDTALAGLTVGVLSASTITSLTSTTTAAVTSLATAATNANAGTNIAAANTAAAGASSFKLGSNTGTVQDYSAANAALATFSTSAGTFSAGALTVNLGTALNSGNLSNLAATTPSGTAPKITFTLANQKIGSGTGILTALLKDGSTATRSTSQRQLTLVYNFTWSSDGTTLTLTAASGNTTATYFTVNSNATVTATIANSQANILSTTGGVALNLVAGNLFSTVGTLATALNAVNVVGNYYYKLVFTGIPLADANGNGFNTVKGTFSVQ